MHRGEVSRRADICGYEGKSGRYNLHDIAGIAVAFVVLSATFVMVAVGALVLTAGLAIASRFHLD